MKHIYKLTFVLLLLLSCDTSAWDYLHVQDPRQWTNGTGTIEEATYTIKPKGTFAEISLYLSFSARGLPFTHDDSLEVQFYFQIKNSTFTDLWLWIGNDIMKALILDRTTASDIYEGIVKRRKDPAILTREYSEGYTLKIFPMAGDETRKVKMTYLVPISWIQNHSIIPLPLNLIKTSMNPLAKMKIITFPDSTWKNPRLLETNQQFIVGSDSILNNYSEIEIPVDHNSNSTLTLLFDSPSNTGKLLNTFSNEDADYYEMALLPVEALGLNTAKKTMIIIDYDNTKTHIKTTELINVLKTLLRDEFFDSDSFNIIVSNPDVYMLSDKWISTRVESLDSILDDFKIPLTGQSGLAEGLFKAADFIADNGNDGSILLISGSDKSGDKQTANEIVKVVAQKLGSTVPIHIIDICTMNITYYYFDDIYYRGNEYLFLHLAKNTKGEYFKGDYYYMSLINQVKVAASCLNGFITKFDINTSLTTGFTYSKFTNVNSNQRIPINKPIIQIGKYTGQFPLKVQISGSYKSELFSKNIEFNTDIKTIDSTLEQLWAGKYTDYLEPESYYSDQNKEEILNISLTKRILSRFAAFIALEPNDTLMFCASCINEGGTTDVEEGPDHFSDTLNVQAYPNPFNSQTKLIVSLPESYSIDQLSIKIYDIVGQEIRTFDPSEYANKAKIEITWNGKNDFGENVASGIYLFVIKTPRAVKSLKLLNFK